MSPGVDDTEALLRLIRESVIGDDRVMETPYGRRWVTYADYTASGRALPLVEDFIRDQVLPRYAHTESSGTGLQTTRPREEAREIIRTAVGGGDDCVVIGPARSLRAPLERDPWRESIADVVVIRQDVDGEWTATISASRSRSTPTGR